MAASMWRMNGLCGGPAAALLLCALLFCSEVMCQDAVTDAPVTPQAPDIGDGAPDSDVTPTASAGEAETTLTPAASTGESSANLPTSDDHVALSSVPKVSHSPVLQNIVPDIMCVGKEDISEQSAVKAEVQTDDCEATKRIIQEHPANWCSSENCNLEIFQDGKTVLVSSSDVKPATVAEVLQSENLKERLGLKIENPPSGPSVFAGILVSGLLVAVGIVVWYFKSQRKPETKEARLAEEAYPVDQENQGNTLVSEAPLNPPPETQEKPNVNGESPEADKTPTPTPTNGHSTAKTADTEL